MECNEPTGATRLAMVLVRIAAATYIFEKGCISKVSLIRITGKRLK